MYIALMVGFPYESIVDINKTVKFLQGNCSYFDGIASFNIFLLEYNFPMYRNPEAFGMENIRYEVDAEHRSYYSFDEKSGLVWTKKSRQNISTYYYLLKSIYHIIYAKPCSLSFPIWRYCRESIFLKAFLIKVNGLLNIFRKRGSKYD